MMTLLALSALAAGPACTWIGPAVVHRPEGPLANGALRMEGAVIAQVGPAGEVSSTGCRKVEAPAGAHLSAGLIDAASTLGLIEVELESGSRDDDAGGDAVRAAVRIGEAYNPLASAVAVQRAAGVTGVILLPSGGRVAGLGAAVALAGEHQAEALRAEAVVMVASLDGSSSAAALEEIRALLEDARSFAKDPGPWQRGDRSPALEGAGNRDLAALGRVISREIPLLIAADRASDLEALTRLAVGEGVRLVLLGAAEGWQVAPALAQAGVAVVLDPQVKGAGSFDQLRGREDNAALLHAAGVPVVIATQTSHNARNVAQFAGLAWRGGLPPDAALRAITETPAQVFGLKSGALAPGRLADVVLWSGAPLSLASAPTAVWIGGQARSLDNRQRALLEAWRQGPRPYGP
jgi:imidazolonepropionase-like amidohydrolase